jgi:hypothetical protein
MALALTASSLLWLPSFSVVSLSAWSATTLSLFLLSLSAFSFSPLVGVCVESLVSLFSFYALVGVVGFAGPGFSVGKCVNDACGNDKRVTPSLLN